MKSEMRVEFVSSLKHETNTGIGRYLHTLAGNLQEQLEVAFCEPLFLPLKDRFSVLANFPVGVLDHVSGSIIHIPQIMGCSMMLWRPYRPAVATVHDLGILVMEEDASLHNPIDRRIINLQLAGLKRMDYLAVNSEKTKQGLIELLSIPEERIKLVPLGIDTVHFRPIPDPWSHISRDYGINYEEGVTNLLYVGSELPRKNLRQLIESMAILKQMGYRVRLIKVGGAGEQQWRDKLVEDLTYLKLSPDVIFTGIVPEDDLPLFLNLADICVTPTLLEAGFAWMAKAAMASGKVVVATEGALIPLEAQHVTVIVKSRDPKEMAQAIASCIENPERLREMGITGRQLVMKYSWEATAKSMLEVYRLAIEGNN